MTVSEFRVRVPGLVFVFKSASLALKQVPAFENLRQIPLISELGFDISIFDRFRWFQFVLDGFRSF